MVLVEGNTLRRYTNIDFSVWFGYWISRKVLVAHYQRYLKAQSVVGKWGDDPKCYLWY